MVILQFHVSMSALYMYVVYVCSSFFVGVGESIIGWLNCDVLSVFFSVFSIFCLKFHHW